MIAEYKALMEAAKTLDDAQYSIYLEDGGSPAWHMAVNARNHVRSIATLVLRESS
jgi:hypothetical protein